MRMLDLTGKNFGSLTVIKRVANKGRHVAWLCRCRCGNKSEVQSNHLQSGETRSCGHCADARSNRLYKSVWNKMFQRCENPNNKDYINYGGRGIKVCEEWRDFVSFRDWALAHDYDPKAKYGDCTIDRIDVDGDYSPNNCRFVSIAVQNLNKQVHKRNGGDAVCQ